MGLPELSNVIVFPFVRHYEIRQSLQAVPKFAGKPGNGLGSALVLSNYIFVPFSYFSSLRFISVSFLFLTRVTDYYGANILT
jgi:hypothetical protein